MRLSRGGSASRAGLACVPAGPPGGSMAEGVALATDGDRAPTPPLGEGDAKDGEVAKLECESDAGLSRCKGGGGLRGDDRRATGRPRQRSNASPIPALTGAEWTTARNASSSRSVRRPADAWRTRLLAGPATSLAETSARGLPSRAERELRRGVMALSNTAADHDLSAAESSSACACEATARSASSFLSVVDLSTDDNGRGRPIASCERPKPLPGCCRPAVAAAPKRPFLAVKRSCRASTPL